MNQELIKALTAKHSYPIHGPRDIVYYARSGSDLKARGYERIAKKGGIFNRTEIWIKRGKQDKIEDIINIAYEFLSFLGIFLPITEGLLVAVLILVIYKVRLYRHKKAIAEE